MKQFLSLCLLTLFFKSSVLGQTTKDYSFKYRLVMIDTLQPSIVSINPFEVKNGTTLFSGKIINAINLPILYATIHAKGKDTSILFGTDEKGRFSYPLSPGEYTITVSSLIYSSTSFQLNWKGSEGFEYLINLGKKPRGGTYNVYSKNELKQNNLDRIKDCLWYNLSDPGSCGVADKYFVVGEL